MTKMTNFSKYFCGNSPFNQETKRITKKEAKAAAAAAREAYDAKIKEQQKDLDPAETSVKPNPPTFSDNSKTRKIPKHGSF